MDSSESDVSEDENPTASPERELLWASAAGDLEAVKRLLRDHKEAVAARDKDQYTPLHRAAYSNHPLILKLILAHGGDATAVTLDGWTPLHCAAKWANLECVRPLARQSRVNINAGSNSGQTPLHLAATNPEAYRTLKYLLRQPTLNKSLTNSQGDTPKVIASRNGPCAHLFDTVQQKSLEESKENSTETGS